MEITTVTVIDNGVTKDYTNSLTQEQKQHIAGSIANDSAVPDIELPDGLRLRDIKDTALDAGTFKSGSIAFTFVCGRPNAT